MTEPKQDRSQTDLFLDLTPERVLEAVESGGHPCNNVCYPLNSFENRVYEVELLDRTRVVAKFYRPERWTQRQILEEHFLLSALEEAEVPVCAMRSFPDGGTLKALDNIHFCLADRRAGRAPDELDQGLATRLGLLIGRLHNVSAGHKDSSRRPLDAEHFVRRPVAWLRRHGNLPKDLESRYVKTADELATLAEQTLRGFDTQLLHADLHLGNVLLRDGVLRLLDFDDMTVGPPVQDIWLALPGRDEEAQRLRSALISGYQQFRLFDEESTRAIEALRGLRIVRYAVWLARRWHDPAFQSGWPHFGTREFWEGETRDLEEQTQRVRSQLSKWQPRHQTSYEASALARDAEESAEELTNKDYFWDWEES